MLILLIPLSIMLPFLILLGFEEDRDPESGSWKRSFLLALAGFGVLVVGVSELLSAFGAISRLWIAFTWLSIDAAMLWVGWKQGWVQRAWIRLRSLQSIEQPYERYLWMAILGISGVLLSILWIAPGNNVDVMQYHLPRALHWAQNRSLAHYPAANIGQNFKPYFAEAVIMHLRILWGDDRPAGLVQFMSMLGSVIVVAEITHLLGGKRLAQWFSAVFAFTIPMGLLQSVTALNDYVAAFWVLNLAYYSIHSARAKSSRLDGWGFSASLGLGMLTKGTFFPYAAPLVAWFFVGVLVRSGIRRAFKTGLFTIFVVAAINGLFWVRNTQTYGGPYGSGLPIETLPVYPIEEVTGTGLILEPVIPSIDGVGVQSAGISVLPQPVFESIDAESILGFMKTLIARMLQMIAMNFITPVYKVNQIYFRILGFLSGPFTPGYIESLGGVVWNHEHLAASPIHMASVLIGMLLTGFGVVRDRTKLLLVYSLVMLGGLALLSMIDYAAWVYSIRYQLAFLLMGAPGAALIFERLCRPVGLKVVMLFLFIYALPYVFVSHLRPVIGFPPWPTKTKSILVEEPSTILFAMSANLRDEYEILTREIKQLRCKRVGLDIGEEDLEYTFWWLLEAPQSGISLKHVNVRPPLDQYIDPDYDACAILCTRCGDRDSYDDLPLALDGGHVWLYMREETSE